MDSREQCSMNLITIPASLADSFKGTEPTQVCDEQGKVLGYYTPVREYKPLREPTEEDYKWAMEQVTPELIEASLKSGPGRPFEEIIADLRRRYGP
jgi:hypothetical protein